ncbi:MAG: tetratricopeptide repeat protein, partial [Acetobacteraceae bacterium]
GEAAAALALYETILAADPAAADAANNAGVLLRRQGAEDAAIRRYRQALAAVPDHPDAGWNLGRALLEKAEADEAYLHLRRAVALRPGWERWHVLGRACQARGDLAGAEAAYGHALADRPEAAETLNNLANLHQGAGRLEAALALQDRALTLAPGNADMHYNRALLLLLLGRWAEGWREHEWRWQAAGFASPRRRFASPAWDGRPLPGGTLLVHWEQGLGDTIQFIRHAAAARARAGRLVLEVQPPLAPLLRGLPGLDAVVTAGDRVPPHDAHAPLLSLPLLLDQPVPAPQPPYLALPAVAREAGRIGLVWAGNPKHLNDRNRSVPLPLLAPLLALPGRHWVSLQVGPRSADIVTAGLAARLEDLSPTLVDFTATAAALARLELLITVDTAVAHLAGALGVPTWLLLPFAPDWRWGPSGTTTPWYGSLRIWRQPRPGDWAMLLPNLMSSLPSH